jgi:hypothetical protein
MDKFRDFLGIVFTVTTIIFCTFAIVVFIKTIFDKTIADRQLEYIVEQCSNNKYVILNDVLIMCPEVIINKPKERKMS